MKAALLSALLSILLGSALAASPFWHLHLALSSDASQMHIQWTSVAQPAAGSAAEVQYGLTPAGLTQSATGSSWSYLDAGQRRTYFFSQATMTALTPGALYFYRVGDGTSFSDTRNFTATRTAAQMTADAPLRIAFLGDLGYSNGQATPFLVAAAAQKEYDHFCHIGDYAYDLPSNNGTNGDLFESSVEAITSSAPYMGCEGNHEGGGGFGFVFLAGQAPSRAPH